MLPQLAKFRGRDYVTDQAYSREELMELLDLAVALKALRAKRRITPFLVGRHLATIFEEPSTRTRVSFENGMAELGGNALYLRPGEIHLPGRESIGDTAQVLSRLNDAIVLRASHVAVLRELADYATVPVINGMCSDYDHPVQTMSDALTILEHAGQIKGLTMGWVGHANNMCNSVVLTCTRLGMNMVVASPSEFRLDPEVEKWARANCNASGAALTLSENPVDAVKDADFVYTDMWWWVQEEEAGQVEERARVNRPYQVNSKLWAEAKPRARFMHCLPAMRGYEVTDEVIDSPASIVFPQAENRMHFQKALVLALIGIDELPADPDLQEIGRALLS
jgi:putrescine carbamoyltransferase